MRILFISCSNVVHAGEASVSIRTCKMAAQLLREKREAATADTLSLSDHRLSNCTFCGACKDAKHCLHDPEFNEIYRALCRSDAVLFVVPFYSVVPSKLTMLLEKLNQLYYTGWLRDLEEPFALKGKRVAVIGHGGTVLREHPAVAETYRSLLLEPIQYCLRSLGWDVVGAGTEASAGAVFGVSGYHERDGAVFPDMVHEWEAIQRIVATSVEGLLTGS